MDIKIIEDSSVDLKLTNENFDGAININISIADPKNSSMGLNYDLDDNFAIGGNIKPNDLKDSSIKLNFKYDDYSIGANVCFSKPLDSTLSGSVIVPIYNVPVKFGINLKIKRPENARLSVSIPLKIIDIKVLDVSVKHEIKKVKRVFTHPKKAFNHERKKVKKILKGQWRGKHKKKRRKRRERQEREQERIRQLQHENELYISNVKEELIKLLFEYDMSQYVTLLRLYTDGLPDIVDFKIKIPQLDDYSEFLVLFDKLNLSDLNKKLEKSLDDKKITFDSFDETFDEFDKVFEEFMLLQGQV